MENATGKEGGEGNNCSVNCLLEGWWFQRRTGDVHVVARLNDCSVGAAKASGHIGSGSAAAQRESHRRESMRHITETKGDFRGL